MIDTDMIQPVKKTRLLPPGWMDTLMGEPDKIVGGIKTLDVTGLLAVGRLVLRHARHRAAWPKYEALCSQARSRVSSRLYRELIARLNGILSEWASRILSLEPLPFVGRLTRREKENRVAHYAAEWDRLTQSIQSCIGAANRKGNERRPVVCMSNWQIFPSAVAAASWLAANGSPKAKPSDVRHAIAKGWRLAGRTFAYADEVGAAPKAPPLQPLSKAVSC